MATHEPTSQADVDTIAMLSTRVSPGLRKRLKRYSVESGKSMQEIVETAITRYLDAEEPACPCAYTTRRRPRRPLPHRARQSTRRRPTVPSILVPRPHPPADEVRHGLPSPSGKRRAGRFPVTSGHRPAPCRLPGSRTG